MIEPTDWVTFLENRLAAQTTQMGLLIAGGGVVLAPVLSYLPSGLDRTGLASNPALVGSLTLGLVVLSALSVFYLWKVIERRRRLIFLMELILSGGLSSPAGISTAYRLLLD